MGAGVAAGGGLFVGPMLISYTSTCSSPVVTLPPVLPPELTLPTVTLVMPPDGGGVGAGVGEGAGDGDGVGSVVRPADPLSRESRVSADTSTASAKIASMASAATIPASAVNVFVCVFVILLVSLMRNASNP